MRNFDAQNTHHLMNILRLDSVQITSMLLTI